MRFIVCLLFIFCINTAYADNVVYVDLQRAVFEVEDGKAAKKRLEKMKNQKNDEIWTLACFC